MNTKIQVEIRYKKHRQLLFCTSDSLFLSDNHWITLLGGYRTQVDYQEYNPLTGTNICYLVAYSSPTYDDYTALIEAMIYEGWIAK